VVDNLMDLTHETFVHGSSIGNREVAEAPFETTHTDTTATITRWMTDISAPPFWADQLGQKDHIDRWQVITFQAPSTVCIDVGIAPTGTGAPEGDRSKGVNGYVLNTMTPETDKTCHYFWAFARNHHINDQAWTTKLRDGVEGVFREDEDVLEAQQVAIDENPDHVFYNLNIDSGSMWARKLIDRMVEQETTLKTAAE
jgi:vanillate O-demethylase monooxygenase subunit